MSRGKRLAALFLATSMLVAGAIAAVATPAAATTDDHVTTGGFVPGPITWQPCPERPTDTTIRCGTLTLPIDWAKPHGATVSLALADQQASDPAQRIGPLLINPGGPGGSGVNFALDATSFFSADVLAHFDIIGFDPRGVARSSPVQCSTSLLQQTPFTVPGNATDYAALIAYNQRLGADCRANTGPLFDHVDSVSVARDMDAIRAALGVHQISYYGVSYGTLIGQMYAELFGDRIRAMVIDSNMDHSLGTGAFLFTESATDEDSFEQFVAWCDRDTTCALHGQDVNAVWTGLMRRADQGTLTIPGTTRTVTWLQLSSQAVGLLYGPQWSELATLITELQVEPATAHAAATPALTGYPLPIFCEDWSLPVSGFQQFRQYVAESNAVAPELRASPLAWTVVPACLGFPTTVNNPQHRLNVHPAFPLLELNSVHDPATPYVWALDDAAQLGRAARFVTYQGWGHGAYPHSSCTTGTVDSYLVDRTLPAPGASCPAVPPPDQTGMTARPMVTAGSSNSLPWTGIG